MKKGRLCGQGKKVYIAERERERERRGKKCVRRELDFKKCHYCYDRSISMTELTLVMLLVICSFGRVFKVIPSDYIMNFTKVSF